MNDRGFSSGYRMVLHHLASSYSVPDPQHSTVSSNVTSVIRCDCQVEYIGYVYVLPILCCIGVITNVLNLLVFTQKHFQGSTFCFLTAMAAMDLMSTLLGIPLGPTRCWMPEHNVPRYIRSFYQAYVLLPVVNAFITDSVWITTAVSVERYIFVAFPFRSRSRCTEKYSRIFVLVIFVSALIMIFPYFFYKRISDTTKELETTDFGQSDNFRVYCWCRVLLLKLIPIAMISVLNGLLIKATCRASRRRKDMLGPGSRQNKRQMDQLKMTTMLITISFVFLVCHLPEPFAHSEVYKTMFGRNSIEHHDFIRYRMVANLLEIISFSTNYFFYFLFNKQFSCTLKRTLRCVSDDDQCVCYDSVHNGSAYKVFKVYTEGEVKQEQKKDPGDKCNDIGENGVTSTYL